MTSSKMPNYTRTGYTSTHEMTRRPVDNKIHQAGIPLKRYGEKAAEYTGARIAKPNDVGQKIRSAGIPFTRQTGGVPVAVKTGRMAGGAAANKVKR